MRRPFVVVATLAFVAVSSSIYLPAAHGQGFFDDLVNELDDLINNNSSNSNNPPPNSRNSSNASRPLNAGSMLVEANTGWTSDPLPANTTIDLLGKRWSLPVAFDVDANGNVTVMPQSSFPAGNRVRISNGSPNDFGFGFTVWSGTPPASASSRSSGRSNNTPSVGTGNVTVINRSSNSVTARYTLPNGQSYGPNGYSRLWQSISPGGKDVTPNIAVGTKVTVDGYDGQDFYVRNNDELTLVVSDDGIAQRAATGSSGSGSPSTGMSPNQVAVINAGQRWQSGTFPMGTRAKVGGSGVTTETTYKLPADVVAFADGGLAERSSVLSGTYLVITNNSLSDVIVEFITPTNSSRPSNGTSSGSSPPSNNQPTGFTGNIRVHNQSGQSITARYTLPAGKTYYFDGSSHQSLYVTLDDRATDRTPNIAEGTKVTVDGYDDVFYVRRGDNLDLDVFASEIGQSAASGSPGPAPNPSPPRLNDSRNENSPVDTTPRPMPIPSGSNDGSTIPKPIPSPDPSADNKPRPTPADAASGTTPLTSAVAGSLTQRINAEVNQILEDFEKASETRVATLQRDLAKWQFAAPAAPHIGRAAIGGDAQKVSELFDDAAKRADVDVTEAAITLYEPLKAIATLRASLLGLSTKMLAGQSTADLVPDLQSIKQLADDHKSPGLADAMAMIQRDLVIRDQINRAVAPANANQPLPSGSVTMIRHPLVSVDVTYLGNGGLILTRATDANIGVVQATAGATTTIDKQFTFERPSLASLRQAAGTELFEFADAQPAAPADAGDLLDLLKAAQ